MEWMLLPYRRFADFSGRSRRREFWLFALFQWLVMAAIGLTLGTTSTSMFTGYYDVTTVFSSTATTVQNLFALVSLIPNLAVSVRRLHDQDRSGWLLLLIFVPFFGWFALFVLMCLGGTRGYNRFGSDPKNPTDIEAF